MPKRDRAELKEFFAGLRYGLKTAAKILAVVVLTVGVGIYLFFNL